jgi:anti-sigma-K factor RskA
MTDDLMAEAGEYVAGLMSPEEAEAFERRLAVDGEARRAVGDWRARLLALDETATQITPSASLWPRIEAAIGQAPAAAPAAQPGFLARIWNDVAALRWASLAAAAAAALFAVLLVTQPFGGGAKPVVVAVLTAPDTREAGAIVEAFADGRVRVVPLRTIPVPEGRTLQVWTLWDRQVGPRSVGLMPAAREQDYRTAGMPRPADQQLYEITLEPAGGSPTGRPTGPILYVGRGSSPL